MRIRRAARAAVEETTFWGMELAFKARSRFRVVMREDNKPVHKLGLTPILDLIPKVDQLVDELVGKVAIARSTKITIEYGYLLLLEFTREGHSVLLTIELICD